MELTGVAEPCVESESNPCDQQTLDLGMPSIEPDARTLLLVDQAGRRIPIGVNARWQVRVHYVERPGGWVVESADLLDPGSKPQSFSLESIRVDSETLPPYGVYADPFTRKTWVFAYMHGLLTLLEVRGLQEG